MYIHFLVLIVHQIVDILASCKGTHLGLSIINGDWIVHGCVDSVVSEVMHLVVPIDTHLSKLVLGLKVDDCSNSMIFQFLDFLA